MDPSVPISSAASRIQILVDSIAAAPDDKKNSEISKAENIVTMIAEAFASSHSTTGVPATFLQSLAHLVHVAPCLVTIAAGFCKIVVAAWTSPLLFSVFVSAVASTDATYTMPTWWPRTPGIKPATGAPFWSTVVCIGPDTAPMLLWVGDLANAVTAVLGAAHAIVANSLSAHPYRTILDTMVRGLPYHDLTMVVVFQVDGAYAQIRAAATDLTAPQITSRAAKLISDMFMQHTTWTAVCNLVFQLSGAALAWKRYGLEQQAALDMALSDPFRVLADLLNQGCTMKLPRTSILVLCVYTSMVALEHMSSAAREKPKMYADFNRCFHTKSLVAVLCDVSYCISRNILAWGGHDMLALAPMGHMFPPSVLPPIVKPDYFLVSADFGTLDETVQMVQLVDSYGDLELALGLALKCLLNAIDGELDAVALTVSEGTTATKVTACVVEQVFACLVTANYCMLCHQSDTHCPTAITEISIGIVDKIVVLAEKRPSIWITLFNFANDVCYADLRLVPVFEQLFDRIIPHVYNGNNSELVECGVLLFFTTFCTLLSTYPAIAKYCALSLPDLHMVDVSNTEYKFIYSSQSARLGREVNRSSSTGISSRLKGYSKYGK